MEITEAELTKLKTTADWLRGPLARLARAANAEEDPAKARQTAEIVRDCAADHDALVALLAKIQRRRRPTMAQRVFKFFTR